MACRDDDTDEPKHTLHVYMAGHHTLMLAYARAGTCATLAASGQTRAGVRTGVENVTPTPAAPETADTDSTDYVQVSTCAEGRA